MYDLEIFQLTKFLTKFHYKNIHTLSFKLNILKRQIKRHVLLLQFMKKILSMIVEKMLSFIARKKNNVNDNELHAFFDNIDTIQSS